MRDRCLTEKEVLVIVKALGLASRFLTPDEKKTALELWYGSNISMPTDYVKELES